MDKKMAQGNEAEFGKREGELELPFDPAAVAGNADIVFIGVIRSPWRDRADCPKNMREARETGKPATIEIAEAYRPGLAGLEAASHIVILSWLSQSPRNLIVQKPRHAHRAKGTFALRSPARPNPVGLHVAKLVAIDATSGVLGIDAIDVLDGTPVVDLKPYYASIDAFPDATITK